MRTVATILRKDFIALGFPLSREASGGRLHFGVVKE